MNVYAIKAIGKYCGGFAVVAAEDEQQAIKLASNIDTYFNVHYHTPHSIEKLDVQCNGNAKVLSNFEMGE